MTTLSERITRLIYLGASISTVFMLPNWSYDPVSAPKLLVISTIAFLALGLFVIFGFRIRPQRFDFFSIVILIFLLLISINLFVNNNAFAERLYGIRGRSTGYLAFVSLALLSFLISRTTFSKKFFTFMLFSNLVVSVYFLIQDVGLDFFSVENFYSAPSSTLGNPNFVSGFVGFSVLSVLIFTREKSWKHIVIICLFLLLNLFVLIRTFSIQGIIALAVGISLFIILRTISLKSWRVLLVAASTIFVIGLLTILGLIGKGPLSPILESSTVFSRLDYWRAAIRMALDNWLFGVGLDAYGDYFRMYRDSAAINRFGPDQVADAAHNVFLDFFASGGIPLGLVFIIISCYPAALLVRHIVRVREDDYVAVTLLSIWGAFQFQALVSVNQLGVGVWGWLLLGTMVAYLRDKNTSETKKTSPKAMPRLGRVGLGVILSIFGFSVSFPLQLSEARFLTYANDADGVALGEIVSSWPQDSRRINFIAQGWINSGNPDRSRSLLLKGLELNPNYFRHWYLLSELPNSTMEEKRQSRLEMRRLDPFINQKNQ